MDLVQKLIQGLHHIEVTRLSQLGSSCIIIYDHLITLDGEMDLIWAAPWSKGKVLFILNRYYGLVSVIFNNYGFFSPSLTPSLYVFLSSMWSPVSAHPIPGGQFFQWQGWTGLVACILAETILLMRLYAMYSLNKAILALMVTGFVASTIVSGWIMHTALSGITATTIDAAGGGKFCVPRGVPGSFYTFWIPMIAFECLLCALALIRGFQAFKSDGSLFRTGRHLVKILIRDSVLYFLVICATYVTCLLVWILAPTSLLEVPIGFSVAMSCVLANRTILNVREINRDLDRRSRAALASSQKFVTLPDSCLRPQTTAATTMDGAPLTQFDLDSLRMMRPATPESFMDASPESDTGHVPFTVL